ncbi:hypothetical protein AeRB84_010204 [Aphanomyces euteiches]|nr:hypothetical protein AeRB84_010204 [Aphanomyces euteiches]
MKRLPRHFPFLFEKPWTNSTMAVRRRFLCLVFSICGWAFAREEMEQTRPTLEQYCKECDVSHLEAVLLSNSSCLSDLESDGFLVSSGKSAKAIMQGDGNFVVVDETGRPTWASMSMKNDGAHLQMQDDGNLVVVTSNGKPVWASKTSNEGIQPYCLHLNNQQTLKLWDSECNLLWQIHNRYKTPTPKPSVHRG